MQAINFKALVLEGKRKISLKYVTFKEKLKSNQVIVKINFPGICGKQIEIFSKHIRGCSFW